MNVKIEVKVAKSVDAVDLWSAVFGSGWETVASWLRKVKLEGDEADWDVPGAVTITAENPHALIDDIDDDPTIEATLVLEDIAKAVSEVLAEGYRDACTGQPITLDPEDLGGDWDACVGNVILQQAVYGEVIYG